MYPQQRLLEPTEHPFNAGTITHFDTMLVEPAVYLPKLINDVQIAGGQDKCEKFSWIRRNTEFSGASKNLTDRSWFPRAFRGQGLNSDQRSACFFVAPRKRSNTLL
ncbi:MAG: hypothetical protein Ct9H90mP25_5720 [Gammaproteobacteria bacterium]|nr:MAG: hypothetical protein Ct9H90mP25_5720 [Gammaproteobacteria bacterium]